MDERELEYLREELTDYYGTAMMNGFPQAMATLGQLEDMSEEELKELAESNGMNWRG